MQNHTYTPAKTAVVTVGLPARRKTFTARALARHLRWIGIRTAVVSVAHLRRQHFGVNLRAAFFDATNTDALEKRTLIANKALDILSTLFDSGIQVHSAHHRH